jgi:hypothetical protein
MNLAVQLPTAAAILDEKLSAPDWVKLLRAVRAQRGESFSEQAFRKRCAGLAVSEISGGAMRVLFPLSRLPDDYRRELDLLKTMHAAQTFHELHSMIRCETRHELAVVKTTGKPWESHPEAAKDRALKRQQVMTAYYLAREAHGEMKSVQIAMGKWADVFGEACNEKTIRRLRDKIDHCGGAHAQREAFLDNKSCDHKAARREVKLGIPTVLIEEFKSRCIASGAAHISSAYDSLVVDWMTGNEVPGLPIRSNGAAFPWSYKQMRPFAPSTPARVRGARGEAAFLRECAPWTHRSVETLRPLEMLVLDDTRIDLIATDDLNAGRLIELKAYILMDVRTRRILGFTIKDGPIEKEDVFSLIARGLRGFGLPVGYPMRILFERGTVACAPAAQTLLESIWPGRIEIHRTGMDGKRAQVGAFWESQSGHWMGKAWIESFMRTLSFMLEQLPGQRGRNFTLQPATLGLKGRDHTTNMLRYDKGRSGVSTEMHEAALTGFASNALEWIENGTIGDPRARLKARALLPKAWVIRKIADNVAFYNARHDHRRTGYAVRESLGEKGELVTTTESADELWERLSAVCPAERVNPADASSLLKWRGKTVNVCAREGVTMDVKPFKGLRFHSPNSLACHLAKQMNTQTKRMVALYDEEALRTWRPGCGWQVEIHLMHDTNAAWQPGDPGRYLETLPLVTNPEVLDEAALAAEAARKETELRRTKLELIQAAGPAMARHLRDVEHDEARLKGVVVPMNLSLAQMSASQFSQDIRNGAEDAIANAAQRANETRAGARDEAAEELARFQAAHATTTTATDDDAELAPI